MALGQRAQNRASGSFSRISSTFPSTLQKGEQMRGHSELCVAFEAKTELARDAKAGSGVRPIADFTQIIFTAIHLFPHLENRRNKICVPLTSRRCFLDKRLSSVERHDSSLWGRQSPR